MKKLGPPEVPFLVCDSKESLVSHMNELCKKPVERLSRCDVSGGYPKCTGGAGGCKHHTGSDDDWCTSLADGMGGRVCGNMIAIRAAIAEENACCGSCESYTETHRGSGSYGCAIHDWCYAPWNVCKRYKPRTSQKVEPIEDEDD